MKYTSIESLTSSLSVLRSIDKDDLDEQYYELMTDAKEILGETNPLMAPFYYQYGSYMLGRIERNGELFGDFKAKQPKNPEPIADQDNEDDDGESNAEQNNNQDPQDVKDQPQTEQQVLEGGVTITSDRPEPPLLPEHVQQQLQAQQVEEDDEEICFLNLESALKIYETVEQQLLNSEDEPPRQKLEEAMKQIAKVKVRLGDFHFVKEAFEDALTEYQEAMRYMLKLGNSSKNRQLAETYYLVANTHLYNAKEGCEVLAIQALVQGINILVNHMEEHTAGQTFPRPVQGQLKVARLPFLPKISDTEYVKELKEIIGVLLDKLEDTEIQLSESDQVKKVMEEQKRAAVPQTSFSFTAPTQPPENLINLGSFGNAAASSNGGPSVPIIRRKAPPSEATTTNSNSEPSAHTQQRQKPVVLQSPIKQSEDTPNPN